MPSMDEGGNTDSLEEWVAVYPQTMSMMQAGYLLLGRLLRDLALAQQGSQYEEEAVRPAPLG